VQPHKCPAGHILDISQFPSANLPTPQPKHRDMPLLCQRPAPKSHVRLLCSNILRASLRAVCGCGMARLRQDQEKAWPYTLNTHQDQDPPPRPARPARLIRPPRLGLTNPAWPAPAPGPTRAVQSQAGLGRLCRPGPARLGRPGVLVLVCSKPLNTVAGISSRPAHCPNRVGEAMLLNGLVATPGPSGMVWSDVECGGQDTQT
jgi:hypothetical protein